tara:strand:- start:2087 stop:2869 length:783 start_codon:yes stop_codon:yes gene_type:complete
MTKQEKGIKVVQQPFDVKPNVIGDQIKDKTYLLTGDMSPITYTISNRGVYWFDEEKKIQREIKYCKNQQTIFVDEMVGPQSMAHITFYDGVLNVPRTDQMLQNFLDLHPANGNTFEEFNPVKIAQDETEYLELEIEALIAAQNLDIDIAEAVMRVELGSKVSTMSSKELKRDLLLYAKRNPSLFLELVQDDNVVLRNFGIKAKEAGIINLSSDQRTFTWASNKRKLMNVPFDEHPYTALAAWFKTDEGMEIYTNIEKQLS